MNDVECFDNYNCGFNRNTTNEAYFLKIERNTLKITNLRWIWDEEMIIIIAWFKSGWYSLFDTRNPQEIRKKSSKITDYRSNAWNVEQWTTRPADQTINTYIRTRVMCVRKLRPQGHTFLYYLIKKVELVGSLSV